MTDLEISKDDLRKTHFKLDIPMAMLLKESNIPGIPPYELLINAEYFRPKFEEIFHKYITKYVNEGIWLSDSGAILEELIECLKNPEEK